MDSDYFFIWNSPLFLADSVRTWLKHLQADQIHNWSELKEVFVVNIKGMYERPKNSWNLKNQ